MVAYEVGASGAFFAAILADGLAHLIASAAFIFAFAMIVKTVAAVVAQFMIVIAGTAVAAVVLFITGSAGTFTAVVTVVAFPVIVPPAAAEFAFHAVFIGGIYRNRKKRKGKSEDIFTNIQQIRCIVRMLFVIMIVLRSVRLREKVYVILPEIADICADQQQ